MGALEILFAIGACIAIDGDTLDCNGGRIRLWGIDAPEMHEPDGPASRRHLVGLMSGKPVLCKSRGRDRYRRIVAVCLVDRRDLACEMVKAGHARDWPKYSHGAYAACSPQ